MNKIFTLILCLGMTASISGFSFDEIKKDKTEVSIDKASVEITNCAVISNVINVASVDVIFCAEYPAPLAGNCLVSYFNLAVLNSEPDKVNMKNLWTYKRCNKKEFNHYKYKPRLLLCETVNNRLNC